MRLCGPARRSARGPWPRSWPSWQASIWLSCYISFCRARGPSRRSWGSMWLYWPGRFAKAASPRGRMSASPCVPRIAHRKTSCERRPDRGRVQSLLGACRSGAVDRIFQPALSAQSRRTVQVGAFLPPMAREGFAQTLKSRCPPRKIPISGPQETGRNRRLDTPLSCP